MDRSLNLDLIDFHKPKSQVFLDPSKNWLAFRKIRFAQASDGDYVVMRQLDLSGYNLNNFPADHIAFVQCNLDGTSFRNTHFQFDTAFINCSIKNVDLASTTASSALFLDCDLTGARFWTKMGWATMNLDRKKVPSFFSGCKIDTATEQFLLEDGNITDKSLLTQKQRLDVAGEINDKLTRIVTAPVLDV